MLIKLYQKSLQLAAHKSSKIFLAIVSFMESSFFPIPPDVMIVPMVIAKKNDYYGIIDSLGNEVLNFEFDRIIEWNDTLVIAKKNDSFSIINIKNNSILIEFNSFFSFMGTVHPNP